MYLSQEDQLDGHGLGSGGLAYCSTTVRVGVGDCMTCVWVKTDPSSILGWRGQDKPS